MTLSVIAARCQLPRKGELFAFLRQIKSSPFGRAGAIAPEGVLNQSMVVLVRPTPSTAVVIFFQLSQPHTPSTRRLVRRW